MELKLFRGPNPMHILLPPHNARSYGKKIAPWGTADFLGGRAREGRRDRRARELEDDDASPPEVCAPMTAWITAFLGKEEPPSPSKLALPMILLPHTHMLSGAAQHPSAKQRPWHSHTASVLKASDPPLHSTSIASSLNQIPLELNVHIYD